MIFPFKDAGDPGPRPGANPDSLFLLPHIEREQRRKFCNARGDNIYSPMDQVGGPEAGSGLMERFREGDKAAANRLVELLYPELRRLSAAKMSRERGPHTWQPTALVNELYLALLRTGKLQPRADSDHEGKAFLALAGRLMKRLLIEHARPLYRRAEKIPVEHAPEERECGVESAYQVEDALSRLAAIDPNFRTIVEMKVFEGLTGDEIAARLGCSPRTVASYWSFAKRWLERELGGLKDRGSKCK